MAFFYRGTTSPRDEPHVPAYSNPLSPQRNPNRLSGGMLTTNDVRGGLTRRFTTNALPSITPIGQQRREAAGDYTVSAYVNPCDGRDTVCGGSIREDVEEDKKGSELSRGECKQLQGSPLSPLKLRHTRGGSCWGAIGDGRPADAKVAQEVSRGEGGMRSSSEGDIYTQRLTRGDQPAGYARKSPVSLLLFLIACCSFRTTPVLPSCCARSLHRPTTGEDVRLIVWYSPRPRRAHTKPSS